MLEVGQPFPDFSLPNQDGKILSLSDFKGKWFILYVYPKDDTPGCTLEGKSFSAKKEDFEKENAVVLGLSQDDVNSHKAFCNKFSFKIDLLSDSEAKLLKTARVTQSEWKGTLYWDRTTFLIDPKGIVKKIYTQVRPEGHDAQVLKDIQELKVNYQSSF